MKKFVVALLITIPLFAQNREVNANLQLNGTLVDASHRVPVTCDNCSGGGGLGTDVNVTDRATRLLGIIYGNLGQLQQRASTLELLVQLRSGGADIDPRSIRALTSSDQVTIANASIAVTGPLTDTQLRASAVPVTANAGTNLNTSALALETGGNLATVATNTGRIPSSPSTDRTTAAAPFSMRLSDGTSFYKATTPSDTQPVSASSLPLPTGAATEATQAETHAAAGATLPAKAQQIGGSDYGGTPALRVVKVDSSGQLYIGGMPVTHVVLDAGGNVIGHVVLDSGSTTAVTQATAANLNATVTQGPAGAAAWKVDGSAVTQPVSIATNTPDVTDRSARLLGHVTVDSAPTTAVTNAGLSNIDVALSTRTKPSDQQHTIIDSGTTAVTQASGANLHVNVDSVPTTAITAATLPLPTGAATESGNLATIATNSATAATSANQSTQITNEAAINVSEAAINAKIPSQVNTALPVVIVQNIIATPPVLTAAQLSNPLLYRAAMQSYCRTNLCAPPSLGK